jgi:hypothetical protein
VQTSSDQTHDPVVDKQEKRKARRDLVALLKRLRNRCDSFDSAKDWMDFLEKQVFPLIDQHQRALGPTATMRLRKAAELTQSTRAGITQACRLLRLEIQSVIPTLPVGIPLLVQLAAGLLIAAAAVVGTAIIVLNVTAVQVDVLNVGCEPFSVPAEMSSLPGFSFPAAIHPDGSAYPVKVSSVVELDTSRLDQFTLRVLGIPRSWSYGSVTSMLLDDGQELIGQLNPLRLEPGSHHTLVLTCN